MIFKKRIWPDLIIATLGPILKVQLIVENLASLNLQDRATKWHYNRNSYPPTPPAPTRPIANIERIGTATFGPTKKLSAERPDNLVFWEVHH